MSDFNLSSFLAEQASEGMSHGEGDFTISHEKAARKMAEFSLPREHAWVLKLIQAGVGWGCDGIKLTQTRTHSTFQFSFSDCRRLPTNQELVGAILRADLESTRPLDAFATGLRLVVEKSHLSFQLLIDTGDVEPQAIYAGVYFGELDEQERASKRRGWGKGITLMLHHIAHTDTNRLLLNYIPMMRHGLPMLMEIVNHAFTCPVPLTVDGRRIDGVFRSGRFPWSADFKPLRSAGVEIPGDSDPPFTMSPGFDNHIFTVFTPRGRLPRLNARCTAEAFVLLAARSERVAEQRVLKNTPQSTFFWVKDGVVVDEHPLLKSSGQLRIFIFGCASDLRTDLTGFQLIRDEAQSARLARVLDRVSQILRLELKADRELFERPPTIERMEEEQLNDLSAPAQTVTRGLRQAEAALENTEDPRLLPYRDFAKSLIRKSYAAIQTVVEEPDYWARSSFALAYPPELKQLADEFEQKPPPQPKPTEIPDVPPISQAKEEKFVWVPPDER